MNPIDKTGRTGMKKFEDWMTENRLEESMWTEEDAIEFVMNKHRDKFRSVINRAIEEAFHPAAMEPQERRVFWVAAGRLFMEMGRSYHAE